MSYWLLAIIIYALFAVVTLLPAVRALLKGVKLNPGGASFDESPYFSDESKKRLSQHYSRMLGTLGFWKKQAEIYRRLHYYSIGWTIPSSVIIPFLAQAVNQDPYSKWLLTLISGHTAILLAFHKGLRVEENFRAFRQGESEFYDLYRRLLDRPSSFGSTQEEQLNNYFDAAENIRKYVRNAEIDNFPTIEQAKSQLSNEDKPPSLPASQ